MKSIEILTNRLASLRDSYDHYTMVDKDKDKAFWIKNDIEEVEILLNELSELKRLKDLEKELGCPLEVVFKAIYKGIKTKKHYEICSGQEFEKYIKVAEPHLTFTSVELDWLDENKYFQDYANQWCFHFDGWERLVKLSDYQKTWWLKGEKENV